MKKSDRLKIKSLQPGFLLVEVGENGRPEHGRLPQKVWEDLKTRGFYGGIIMRPGVELKSLSDEDLKRAGLQRLPEGQ